MKIVDVSAFYAPKGGGVRTYVERKLKAGPALGHEIVVIAPGKRDEVIERGPGARIRYVAAPPFPLDRAYRYFDDTAALYRAISEERPDHLEASSPWRSAESVGDWPGSAPRTLFMHADPLAAYAYRWFGPIAPIPLIDRGFDWFWRHLRRMGRRYDAVVAPSVALAERLTAGGVANVVALPMGVEPGSFSPAHRDDRLRTELLASCGLTPDAMLLVAAGRLAPEKRLPVLIEAATAAAARHPIGLIIVGDGRDRTRVLRHIGGNPHIRLLPAVRDRLGFATLLASADALLHGCEAETFCMIGTEARASGLPVIMPDAGGARDHAGQGAGVVYASGSSQAAAAAILEMADALPAFRANALAGVAGVRTMDSHFAELFALQSALGERRAVAA